MSEPRLVWDLPLRLFHWLLVVSVVASWVTGKIGTDVRALHMWLGYWMLFLLAFRLVWGIVGPRHARFASFVPRPRALIAYLRASLRGEAAETPGHSPLGSLAVFAMLAVLALQAISGLFIDDDVMHEGPYRDAVGRATAATMSSIHHNAVNVIVALVVVHVAAIAWYTLRKRQHLLRAMITGRKPAQVVAEHEAIGGSRIGCALLSALVVGAFVYWLLAVAPP